MNVTKMLPAIDANSELAKTYAEIRFVNHRPSFARLPGASY